MHKGVGSGRCKAGASLELPAGRHAAKREQQKNEHGHGHEKTMYCSVNQRSLAPLFTTHQFQTMAADVSCPSSPTDANDAVQNFLRSLQGSNVNQQQSSQQSYDQPFTTLSELLNTNTTISFLSGATPMQIDGLCANLPPSLFLLAQESSASTSSAEPNPETTRAAIEAMSTEQKRELLARVLRTPQLNQSLGSLTVALRDGGLPMVAGALGVDVEHGGTVRGGTVPLGGGQAVEAFLNGVKRSVEKEKKK